MLSPRDKVNDYEVIAPLGTGGMAQLYLARRRGAGGFARLVTLKFVHEHLSADEDIIRLFLQEARLSAHIAHPNVVRVEEVGRCGDAYFIAMEYVHGVSLSELLVNIRHNHRRLDPAVYLWLAAQIAEALHAAHEAKGENGAPLGIVHHDVSPQNVLVSDTGHVKLIDFGIARAWTDSEERRGRPGLLGKLRYMAPEQLMREHADRRADVYALGVILWEMLTGRNLLGCRCLDDARDWATRADPPAPSRFAPHTSEALDRALLKALACEPSRRFADALQFRAALLDALPAAARLDAPAVAGLLAASLSAALSARRACPAEERTAENFDQTAGAHAAARAAYRLDGLTLRNGPMHRPALARASDRRYRQDGETVHDPRPR